jgi:thiopurine S-methyltransferase
MHHEFWHQRWQEGKIGFHEGKPNEHLLTHAAHLALEDKRVLVPLCGKTVDLAWLAAQGAEVVGVELVASAVEAFFREQGLTPERTQVGVLERFRVPDLTVFAGGLLRARRGDCGWAVRRVLGSRGPRGAASGGCASATSLTRARCCAPARRPCS